MSLDTLEIHSQIVTLSHLHHESLFETILAIHLHVVRTLNATMESALVCPNTKEIHTKVVDLNAFSIRTALETRLAFEANVSILALEHVDKMRSVRSSTTFRCVAVQMEWLEMLLYNVDHNKLLQ